MNKLLWMLAALALTPVLADSGVVETSLSRSPRVRDGLGSTVEQAWPKYQAMVESGVVTNDLMALTGHNLNGQQDDAIKKAYQDLWLRQAVVIGAKTPASVGVEVVTIVAKGEGGNLVPREVTEVGEIPLPIYGMTWGHSVTHGLVSFRKAGTYRAFAKNLVIGQGKSARALRLLTWWDCGNSSVTLPAPMMVEKVTTKEVPGAERVVVKEVPGPERVVTIEAPGRTERVEVPVPGPERCVTRVEFVDRVREIRLQTPPLPTQRVEIVPVILADSRRGLSGPGQLAADPGQVTIGHAWAISAAMTWRSTPKVTTSGSCPTPVTPPNPGTLPGDPPAVTPPPTDTTLPANPGGVPPVSGADGAVNTPPASDPADFPPGSVVIPIASPGSAAANAANLLPG